ncbi:MAG TPA: sodium/proton-translocating pyrophosphatase, partial [Fimbriimonas sp.]
FLAGAILSGQLMAVLLANSGGMWDNAKKLIEDGLYGGKGTDAHKAGVVCDTVGDPFKDTAGPALNPLIKVMNLVALLLAPVVIQPLGNVTLSIITVVCVIALAISVAISKKGSMSQSMIAATHEGEEANHHFSSHEPALEGHVDTLPAEKRRRLTVEELNKTDDTPE